MNKDRERRQEIINSCNIDIDKCPICLGAFDRGDMIIYYDKNSEKNIACHRSCLQE